MVSNITPAWPFSSMPMHYTAAAMGVKLTGATTVISHLSIHRRQRARVCIRQKDKRRLHVSPPSSCPRPCAPLIYSSFWGDEFVTILSILFFRDTTSVYI